jgi:hypothetical protein
LTFACVFMAGSATVPVARLRNRQILYFRKADAGETPALRPGVPGLGISKYYIFAKPMPARRRRSGPVCRERHRPGGQAEE